MTYRILIAGLAATLLAGAAQAADYPIASIDGAAADPAASISFLPDGRISATSGCNTFNARGLVADGGLSIVGPVAATKMACVGETLTAQDDALSGLLNGRLQIGLDLIAGHIILTGNDHVTVLQIATTEDR